MPTGGFIGFSPTARATGNAGVNSIFLTPLVAQQNGTATAVLIDTPNATSSISFKALVYDGSHSALLATGSTVTSVLANYNRLPLTGNLSVVAGTTYYVGYVCANSANVTIQTSGGAGSWFVSGGQSVASPANPLVGGASNAGTFMVALELDGTGSSGFGFGLDQASGVTLSSSNTVATLTSTASLGARSVVTHLPGDGKFYAEVVVGGAVNSGVGVGVAPAIWGTTQGTGTARAYVGFLLASGVGAGTNIGLTFVSGDVIGIASDTVNNFLWWNKNNGSWFGASSIAGNPVTPSGGLATSTTLWPATIAISTGTTGTAAAFTLRDTAGAFQYAMPSGYSPWSSATYSPPSVGNAVRAMVLA